MTQSGAGHGPDVAAGKRELRAWARQLRSSLQPVTPAWTELLPLLEQVPAERYLLTWLPMPLEPDSSGLARFASHRLAVTRTPESGAELTLHRLDPDTRLERHRFGFMQPVAGTTELDPQRIGLALVPGLAFDRSGGRLGHGKGHYDRLLERLAPGTPLVGVVHDSLVVGELPVEQHDVRMTHLLTGRALIQCG